MPSDVVAPFAVASLVQNALTANWEYVFGFLPAGDYTLAFACNTASGLLEMHAIFLGGFYTHLPLLRWPAMLLTYHASWL